MLGLRRALVRDGAAAVAAPLPRPASLPGCVPAATASPHPPMAHAETLADSADLLLGCIESAPFAENTFVASRRGDSGCLVVDPGFEPGAVIEWIESHGLEPRAILLTHGHSDHIAGNAALKARWPGLPILVGRGDAAKLTDPAGNLSGAFGFNLVSPPADRLLADGESLDLAGFALTVLAIPGHSSGHVVYRVDGISPRLVFGGDVLFLEGIGRTDFPDGDFAALAAGIRRHLYALPDDTVILPGHGPATTVGHERRHNPFVPATAGQGGAPRGAG